MPMPLRAAKRKAIHILSRLTMLAHTILVGDAAMRPPATNRFLRVKSIFTEKMIKHLIFVYPTGGGILCLRNLNAHFTLVVSLLMACFQKLLPLRVSSLIASS